MMPRISRLIAVLSASQIVACSAPLAVSEPTIDENDDQVATCKVAKDPLNPMIIEWPGTSKIDFDVRSQVGLVAVSYKGCTLKVLPRCNIGGKYALKTVTPARDSFAMNTATDLYARLPLGAAALKGELTTGATLELDYVAVGQRVAEGEPSPGRGDCEGVTHYVASVTVGAYSLNARAQGSASAGVDLSGAGAGIKRSEGVRRLRGSGDVDACGAKPEASECGAVIQLGLLSLPGVTPAGESSPVPATAEVPRPAPTAAAEKPTASCPTGMASIPGGTWKAKEYQGWMERVGPFCLDVTEVTVSAYAACVKAGTCTADKVKTTISGTTETGHKGCNWGVAGRDNHPMNCVDWGMASTYCGAQGKRLPTAEEWDWAARGGDEARRYPWGSTDPNAQLCWSGSSPRTSTCAVGSFPNDGPWGLRDMGGNVREWTDSSIGENSGDRALRGVSWRVGFNASQAGLKGNRSDDLGFRCAK